VFARRIGVDLARDLPAAGEPVPDERPQSLLDPATREHVAATMADGAGVLRSRESLGRALGRLRELGLRPSADPGTAAWEATNLHTVASFVAEAARLREETRGSHWREDFPDRDDDHWGGHLVGTLAPPGPASSVELAFEPLRVAVAP
jgi:succinate dehydrogenase/fumarate reductase flavoprotein subunit